MLRFPFLLVVGLFLCSAAHTFAGTNSWTQIGPALPGVIGGLAADPTNASVMYQFVLNTNTNPDTANIYKSTDRGATWNATPFTSPAGAVIRLAVAPSNSQVLYFDIWDDTGTARFFRSPDGGTTWTLRNLGLLHQVQTFAIDANDADTLYASTADGLFKTTNGGGLWTNVSLQPVSMLVADPVTSGRVYGVKPLNEVLRTVDAGATWQSISVPLGIRNLAIDPDSPSVLYGSSQFTSGGGSVVRSLDFGSTWTWMGGRGLVTYRDAYVDYLAVLPGSGGTVLAHTVCGFSQSFDFATTWVDANAGAMPMTFPSLCPSGVSTASIDKTVTTPAAPRTAFAGVPNIPANGITGGLFEFNSNSTVLPPTCYLSASQTTVAEGGTSTLSAYCSPIATSYVWSANTGFASSASGGSVTPSQTTTYTVQGVNANGPSSVASVTVVAPGPRLANISTRAFVQTGNDVVIGGLIVGGTTPKKVMIRATGPSLAAYGVTDALQDPQLELLRSGVRIGINDDWQSAANQAEMTAAGLQPNHPKEAAILATLDPGLTYTAIVSGVGGTSGTGMVEFFEVDHPETPIANLSSRSKVLTGSGRMIAGFIIQGNGPRTVVVSVAGPSLTAYFPASELLANPTLTLVRASDSAIIGTNDDWLTNANAQQIQDAGFAPNNQREPALMVTLPPGAYTAIVEGAGGTTGTAVVGVFAVP